MAKDTGNIVRHSPSAILKPRSVADIARMVIHCRKNHLKIGARGQGHSTFGQSQVEGGVVVDMSGLNVIHSVESDRIVVDAGAIWRDVLTGSSVRKLTPPVLTGFLGLSVGGTLSLGGIGAMSHRLGAQVDHVLELEVVTGEGEIVTCSPRLHRDLYEAVLAGLGQCAIVARATVRLVPAPTAVRCFLLNYYDDAPSFFSDLRTLARRGELDLVSGSMMLGKGDRWFYQIHAGSYYSPPDAPDTARLLSGLHFDPRLMGANDAPYAEYHQRFDVLVELLQKIGAWNGVVRPWFDALFPDSGVERCVRSALGGLGVDDIGPTGLVLLCPIRRSPSPRPLFCVPDEDLSFLFHILTAADSSMQNPGFIAKMLARNRRLFEAARDAGGTLYPVGAVQMAPADWRRQYGTAWGKLSAQKRRYDPDAILTPGPGIF